MRSSPCGLFFLLVGACGGSLPSPHTTLQAYAQAMQAGDTDRAYRLLSKDAKRNLTPAAFARMVRERPEDAAELARSLRRPTSDPIVIATAVSRSGEEVRLVYEHHRWRVDGASLDLYGQHTPRQAVQTFVRAFERKRYDILLRLIPAAKKIGDRSQPPLDEARLRAAWEGEEREEMEQVAHGFKANLATMTLEETAAYATMRYGSQATVQLVREQGLWKIETWR